MAWGFGNIGDGGSSFLVGMISVTYPENSDLTITTQNDGRYTKKDLSDTQTVLYIKDYDTYTFTSVEKTTQEIAIRNIDISSEIGPGQCVLVSLGYSLVLIDGTYINPITGSWKALDLAWGGTSSSKMWPGVSSSSGYYVLSGTTNPGGGAKASYGVWTNWSDFGVTKVDLSAYNYLILEYDVQGTGTDAGNYRKCFTNLYVCNNRNTMYPSEFSQSSMTLGANREAITVASNSGVWARANGKLTNQKMVLNLTSVAPANRLFFISIGVNGNNDNCAAIVTVKKLYATNYPGS